MGKNKGGKNKSVDKAGNKSQNESVGQAGNKSILQINLSSESATPPPAGAGANLAANSTPAVQSAVSSCGLCRFPDNEEMVACDKCEQWFHFKCVGVGDSVADRDFNCKKCRMAAILEPALQMNTVQKSQTDQTEKSSNLEVEVEQLRRRLDDQLKAFEEIMQKKDEERKITVTRERELFDAQLQAVKQQHQLKLQDVQQQQKQWLDPKAADFVPQTSRSDFGGGKSAISTIPKTSSTIIGGSKSTSSTIASNLEHQRKLLEEKQALEKRHLEERIALEQSSERREEEPAQTAAVNNSSIRGWSEADLLQFLAQNSTNELSQSQLAARQAVARELPPFDGNPEDWPLFIASFESSTRICGYSDEENLLRLQRSLKGKALETVRCRLLHPSNLAGVIVTLRTLFGRPEIIIHSLITKIKEMPSPKTEKLDTLIEFGVAVQNMCATIKACGLDDYMCNVALLQELVERLPPTIKLNWAIHRQTFNRVTMMEFGDWLGKLVEAACSVTIPSIGSTAKLEKRGRKDDNFVNVHSDSTLSVQQPREASASSVPSKSPKECVICGGECVTAEACEQFQELDVDSRWSEVRAHKLCRKCLQKHFGACQIKGPCGKYGCTFMHNQLLHGESRYRKPEDRTVAAVVSEGSTGEAASQNCNTHLATPVKVLFRYVPVTIHGRGVTVNTYAFLDDGSSATFIEHGLLEELNLEGESHPLCLNWTGGQQREENESVKLSLKISGIHDQSKQYVIPKVHTVRNLSLPRQSVSMAELAAQYKHLEGLPVESFASVSPRILIGVDNVRLGYPVQSHEGSEDQPIAVKTRLGWIVYGPCEMTGGTEIKDYTAYHSFHISACDRMVDSKLNTTSKDYLSPGSPGMYKSSMSSLLEDDRRALERLSSKTQLNGDRFETGLEMRRDSKVYDVRVITFGATYSPSSAQFVKNLNAAGFQEHFSRAVECVANENYVNDMLKCTKSEEEVAKLDQVDPVRVPRCYRSATTPDNNTIQLHVIVDTSENGIAAIAYRRFEQAGTVQCTRTGTKRCMSTKQIVANEGTKWHRMLKFSRFTPWFRGPEFPWQSKEERPWYTADLGKTTEKLRPAEIIIYSQPQRQPKDEVFRILLVDIKFVINSRPLTHVPIDSRTDYPLTPKHFLLGSSNGSKPPIAFDDNPVQLKNGRKSHRWWQTNSGGMGSLRIYRPTLEEFSGFDWSSLSRSVTSVLHNKLLRNCWSERRSISNKGWSGASCYRPDSPGKPESSCCQDGSSGRRFEFEYVRPERYSGILRTGGSVTNAVTNRRTGNTATASSMTRRQDDASSNQQLSTELSAMTVPYLCSIKNKSTEQTIKRNAQP